jgi:hypothetical protein
MHVWVCDCDTCDVKDSRSVRANSSDFSIKQERSDRIQSEGNEGSWSVGAVAGATAVAFAILNLAKVEARRNPKLFLLVGRTRTH